MTKPMRYIISLMIIGLMALVIVWAEKAIDATLSIDGLRCENKEAPLGLDTPYPHFSWVLHSTRRNVRQGAYRLVIASSPEKLSRDQGDFWDSGKVVSDEQNGIGIPNKLKQQTRYYWKIKMWDQLGKESPWSSPSTCETGFFDLESWPAAWLKAPKFSVNYARREFLLPPGIKIESARLYVAATGTGCNSYEVRLNGIRVGDDLYAPGPCEPFKALYSTFDIQSLLKPGANAVALLYNTSASLYMTVKYVDGTSVVVSTDGAWKGTGNGPYQNIGPNNTWGGGQYELYDARQEQQGWDKPGFDDHQWQTLAPLGKGPWAGSSLSITKLKARLVPCKPIAEIKPISIMPYENGRYIVDFGQEVAGHIRLVAKGAKSGSTLSVRYAEMLTADGKQLDQYSITRNAQHAYIFADDKAVVYEPRFFNVGFRYVEITGYPGQLLAESITSLAVASDVVNGSTFSCSSPVLNRLQTMAVWSFLGNLQNIPTDCPGRERRGWTADCHVVSAAECLNFDMRNFMDKWLDDYVDCQEPGGWIPVELPMKTDGNKDIKWPASSIFIPWDLYQAYGDKSILEKYYPLMSGYLKFLRSIAKPDFSVPGGGMWRPYLSYGDWLAPEPASSAYLGTLYYYRCADLMRQIADTLNKKDDAKDYAALASTIKAVIQTTYRKGGGTVYYDNNSQSANAHALGFGIVADADRPAVLKSLIDDYQAKGHNTMGFLGIRWALPVLSAGERNDIAYSYITNPGDNSWVAFINKCDATTMLEEWDVSKKSSQNHAFLAGSLSEWFFQDLAGISAQKPGFKEIRIKPYIPADVQWAKASINTVRGWVRSEWKKEESGALSLLVSIPVNSTATIYIPAGYSTQINASGSNDAGSKADAVKHLRDENGCAVYSVGSGSYEFTVFK